ncbi:MAG TPA: hypothetical protein VK066_20400 [Chloroflexota bacterium]|nr:hypothetical protein [Chloroflexota bacterium]
MDLELSNDERGLLAGLVDESLRSLKEEIYKTETYEYKEQLKEREALMMGILQKLNAGAGA